MRSAVFGGTITESNKSVFRSVPPMIPATVNGWFPMKTAGRVSSVVMPSRSAMLRPRTATGCAPSAAKSS